MTARPGNPPRTDLDASAPPFVALNREVQREIAKALIGRMRADPAVSPDLVPGWDPRNDARATWDWTGPAHWQREQEHQPFTDDPLHAAGGYRDNPRVPEAPAPVPPRPAWWRRVLCAIGLHQAGTPTTCCACCESVCGP